MANRRSAAILAGAITVAALLVIFWRNADAPAPSGTEAKTAAAPIPARVSKKKDGPPVASNVPMAKAPPLGKNPRPITDAPHFSTIQEYRAEQAARPLPPEALVPSPAGRTPENEVQRIQGTIRRFRAAFGENPVGSNPEITRALTGKNPTGAKFLDAAGLTLNAAGEMLDDWGMPYFFHPVSGTIMEIRSAGPDRKLFTTDDIVR